MKTSVHNLDIVYSSAVCFIEIFNSALFGHLQEFMEVLGNDLRRRLENEKETAKKS